MLGSDEWLVIRVIATFAVIASLAYVLGRPDVRRLEHKLGITQLAIAGMPFVALGMLARTDAVGVLDDELMAGLSTLIAIGLAMIGMRIGLGVDLRHVLATPRPIAVLATTRWFVGGCVVFIGVLATAAALSDGSASSVAIRIAAILALGATITALTAARGSTGVLATEDIPLAEGTIRLGELVSIMALLVATAYERDFAGATVTSALPAELWLLTALGLAVVLGVLVFQLLHDPGATGDDAPVFALGAIAIVAGVASYLGFSPLAIGVLVGVVLGGLAPERERLEAAFARYQRSIFGLLLFVLGALAVPVSWTSAAIAAAFVIVRFAGVALATEVGLRLGGARIVGEARRRLLVSPLGASSIAVVVAAYQLAPDVDLSAPALALICATLATELAMHARRGQR